MCCFLLSKNEIVDSNATPDVNICECMKMCLMSVCPEACRSTNQAANVTIKQNSERSDKDGRRGTKKTLVILSARNMNKSVGNTDRQTQQKKHMAAYRQDGDGNSPIMKSYTYLLTYLLHAAESFLRR